MIAAFMAYTCVVSLLFGLAALGTEQVWARRQWPRRFIWILALTASLIFPLSMSLTTTRIAVPERSDMARASTSIASVAYSSQATPVSGVDAGNLPAVAPSNARTGSGSPDHHQISFSTALTMLWAALSTAVVLFYAGLWIRLARITRQLPRIEMDGSSVRVTNDMGPAVFGFLRPAILMPKWLLEEASPATRSIALRHECQHIAARDPLLLLLGLLLLALTPWNLAQWWQLRRLRFAIETDCDARVLREGVAPSTYGDVLLAVGRHPTVSAGARLLALSARCSWLERRVRIMATGAGQVSHALVGSGAALAVAMVVVAMLLHAPGLANPAGLRKLPPQDTRPAAQSAEAIARSRFPELFASRFEGSAVIAVVLNRDGSLRWADKHLFPSGAAPADFDMAVENQQLGVDPQDDILDGGREEPDYTIGPWLDSENPGRLFLVYEILKWPHDPRRTRQRAQAALETLDPQLLNLASPDKTSGMTQVTVFMNADGTVNRAKVQVVKSITDDALQRFAAMGITKEQLGRRGFASVLTRPVARTLFVDYAWPKQPDDPDDVAELNTAWREVHAKYPPRRDNRDDAAIVQRYFPDIEQRGRQAITEVVDGKRSVLTPWILLGRDGSVWDAGLWHNEADFIGAGRALLAAVEARYPGIRVAPGNGSVIWQVSGVPITCLWITPDSPVQNRKDVDLRSRKDLLVTGAFLDEVTSSNPAVRTPNPYPLGFASAMSFGVPTRVGFEQLAGHVVQVTATDSGDDEVMLTVRTPEQWAASDTRPASTEWSPSARLRVRYGGSVKIDLTDPSTGELGKSQLVLRPQRLAHQ